MINKNPLFYGEHHYAGGAGIETSFISTAGPSFFILVLLFRVLRLVKVKDHGINAIAQPGWWRAIIKNMAQVGLASSAFYFRSLHAM